MLVLSRRGGETIRIGDDIEIQIVTVRGSGDQAVVRIGIRAPRSVTILRDEVYREVARANQESARTAGDAGVDLVAVTRQPSATGGAEAL